MVEVKNSMKITFRNKDHFYKIVHWLNTNVGKGKESWTIHGKVLKHLRNSNGKAVSRSVLIHKGDIDLDETKLYLTLI